MQFVARGGLAIFGSVVLSSFVAAAPPPSPRPAPGSAPRLIDVPVRAAVVMGDLSIRPVPQLRLRVLGAQGEEVVRTETDLDGRASVKLAPGNYRIETVEPVKLWGSTYSWSVPVDVTVDMRPVELTQRNAGREGMATYSPGGFRPGDEAGLFEKLKGSVFTVQGGLRAGTGFLVDPQGLVLTSAHILVLSDQIRVQLDERTKVRALPVLVSEDRDLAVLAISPSRCAQRAPLGLAEADAGLRQGERVLAIGSPALVSPPFRLGLVTTVAPPLVFSDLNIKPGFSGGPLLTLDGQVVGVNTFLTPFARAARGAAGAIGGGEARAILAAARKKLPEIVAASAPSDELLPLLPTEPYPADAIKEVVHRPTFDATPYRRDYGKFKGTFMTPPVMAWRQTELMRVAAARGASKVDLIQMWEDWESYVGEHRAAVVIHVVPKTGKKGGLKGVFNTVTNAIAVVGSFGMATMDDLTLPNDYEFKADFREAHLLRDGVEVVPAERLRLPAVAHEWVQEAKGRELSFQGVYVYRPDDFAPHPDGNLPRFTLVIEDARKPGSPVRFDLDPQVLDAIRKDFSVYHPGTAPASAKAPIPSPAPVSALSRCHSTYNPVALGMEWEYRSVVRSQNRDGQQTTNETTSKHKISDLTPDTVTISWAQPGWMSDIQYRCESGHPLTPAQEVAGTRTTYRGSEIPPGSTPGLKWERVLESTGPDSRHVQVTRYEVVGMETITVAGGQFESLKVSYETLPMESELFDKKGQKKKMPGDDMENRIHGFSWYAPQVGLVRNAYESTIKFKGKVDSTTEAVQELVAFRP